jgi:signal transduction histidine kinase
VRFVNEAKALHGRWFDVSAFRLGSEDSRTVAVLFNDITDRKRLERSQQDFVAMASHDLATPVTVLRARAQLMQRRKAYDQEAIDAIIEQTSRMERLIADLRDLVRLETGQIELRLAPVDLRDLVRAAAGRIQVQATTHTVRLEIPETPARGNWDPDRLGQVLDNLMSNAVRYSRSDGEITIRVEVAGAEALVSVADEGDGIAADVLPRLFERYYRADRGDDATGLGIGLYISRMLVEAHGGRIWAKSAPGQGSTFAVALPI